MVLNDLGKGLTGALNNLFKGGKNEKAIAQADFDLMLKEVCKALLAADVNVKLVQAMRKNIKERIKLDQLPANQNKRRLIQTALIDELTAIVDPGVEAWAPKKGELNKILMVGLQGSGKTTTCSKLAHFYKRKGFKVALICADTFRAGAFDQLKQNAAKCKVPFYGSYEESDPVQIVTEGLRRFEESSSPFEIIIIDTSGRHRQEEALFDEMIQISNVVRPSNIVLVMDGSIGQAAEAHSKAFKEAVEIGSVIISKMDGHAKGGGAISAVACTGAPITHIGVGEHIGDLETFSSRQFIEKLMGMGDLGGLMEAVSDLRLPEGSDLINNLEKGKFSLKDMKEQLGMVMQMGPLSRVMGMIPGMNSEMFKGSDGDMNMKLKKMMIAMDSMTKKELLSDGTPFTKEPTRIERVCRGSGSAEEDVTALLQQHAQFGSMIKGMGGMSGMMNAFGGIGGAGGMASAGDSKSAKKKTPNSNPFNISPEQMAEMQNQLSQMMSGSPSGGGRGGNDMMEQLRKLMSPKP